MAIEAAAQLMLKYPNSVVAVKDLQSGELTAIDYKSGLRLYEDGRTVGRIIEDGSASTPPDRRWGWSIVFYVQLMSGIVTSGRASTLSEAKADFRRNWERVRA
jgi:hypothetical protein